MIRAQGLRKCFGYKTVLQDLDLEVKQGEFLSLVGPNGSGKTTLLRVLASLSRADAGQLEISSWKIPEQAEQARRQVGLVSHQPLLYRDLTAEENLWFFSRLYRVEDYRGRSLQVLEDVGLVERKDDLVRTFSRGMMQRLSIARAVIHDPDVLLFDEPYTGLDQDAGGQLDNILRKFSSRGRTILMTSHDLSRAAGLAERVAVLSRGRIAASTAGDDLSAARLVAFYRAALQPDAGQV